MTTTAPPSSSSKTFATLWCGLLVALPTVPSGPLCTRPGASHFMSLAGTTYARQEVWLHSHRSNVAAVHCKAGKVLSPTHSR
jgi:hypothetical protein